MIPVDCVCGATPEMVVTRDSQAGTLFRVSCWCGRSGPTMLNEAKALGEWGHIMKALEGNEKMVNALRPFAAMSREGTDPKEVAVTRGYASDMTIVTSGDFDRAAEVVEEFGQDGEQT